MKINFAALKNIEHKVLFYTYLASLFFAVFIYVSSIVISKNPFATLVGLFSFIAPAMLYLVYSVSNKTSKKFPLATKIISALLNIYIIIFIQIFHSFGVIAFATMIDFEPKTFTQKEDYKEALEYVCHSKNTKHFPKEIPDNAKNVKLYKPNDCWFGSDSFSLYLESDRNFIIDSFRGINCIETEGPYNSEDKYKYHTARNRAVENVDIKKTGLKFCVIDSYGDTEEHGIAVDYKNNRILFYSILLD